MDKYAFFSHEKIDDRLYIVTEGYCCAFRFTIGVVVGDKKIIVIDTGLGMTGELRSYIEHITGGGKPMICLCTHNHIEHVGSAVLFDEAYCSHLDKDEEIRHAFGAAKRMKDLRDYCMYNDEVCDYCREHMIVDAAVKFRDIADEEVFDAGGVGIRAIAIHGHTDGSFAFYIEQSNALFAGDCIGSDVQIHHLDRDGIARFTDRLRHIHSIIDDRTIIYSGRIQQPVNKNDLESLIEACEDIIAAEKTSGDPPAEIIFEGQKNKTDRRMHYVRNIGVMYSRSLTTGERVLDGKNELNFHSFEKFNERIYVLTENYSRVNRFTTGLVIGKKAALAIDTGMGMEKKYHDMLKELDGEGIPLWCAVTHGAIDHAGAAVQFERRFLPMGEATVVQRAFDQNRRLSDLYDFSLRNDEVLEYVKKHMIEDNTTDFELIEDGHLFDLGGVTVEAILTPGHSPGHMSYYVREDKVLFAGDAVNIDTHINKVNRSGMAEYAIMLERLANAVGNDVVIYTGHNPRPFGIATVRNLANACSQIADMQIHDDPPGETIFAGRHNNPSSRLHYCGNCCIAYNKNLIIGE